MTDFSEPTVTVNVDGIMYTSTKLPCAKALELLGRCGQVLGERGMRAAIQRHARAAAELVPQLVIDAQKVNVYGAMLQISYGLQQDPGLPRDLLAQVKCNAIRPTGAEGPIGPAFDHHFAGELPHLFRVLEKVAVHNFLGFTLGPRFRWEAGSLSSALAETGAFID